MAKPHIKFRSQFPQVVKAAHDTVNAAVEEALISGQETAQQRLEGSGYDLNPFEVQRKNFGDADGGMIYVHSDKWYYRFFETGTVYIPAKPFMRPAHRVMRKTFEKEMGNKFEGFVRRRARIR